MKKLKDIIKFNNTNTITRAINQLHIYMSQVSVVTTKYIREDRIANIAKEFNW